ncbi:alpha-E domain-containing protein [Aquibacillus koreensis]|uniref:Alpha-E domain-containing protein n=1 Tax=Aquibacillus koreensis TaxID=279446 RepID=A0A9X3WJ69_9BACI|nr:alpha-E domain-containing protein [Aquibacillus koreensis]MCT2534275.1 alpha-E domain-containing protein [Aquibacillus koreensis]MDC3420680.1 alpha-E domain-containing protein [Aquibacillus koreensis]
MLSRVADSLYWMSRYIERAENNARILSIQLIQILEASEEETLANHDWEMVIEICGSLQEYREASLSLSSEKDIINYLLFSESNLNSIANCVRFARENAKVTRDHLPDDLWETWNDFYLLFQEFNKVNWKKEELQELLKRLKQTSLTVQGIIESSMTRGNTAYRFIKIGKWLERAEKTTLILNVVCQHTIKREEHYQYQGAYYYYWRTALQLVNGYEAYLKQNPPRMVPNLVLSFLISNDAFPRSIVYCIEHVREAIFQLEEGKVSHYSWELYASLDQLLEEFDKVKMEGIKILELCDMLHRLQQSCIELGSIFSRTYYLIETDKDLEGAGDLYQNKQCDVERRSSMKYQIVHINRFNYETPVNQSSNTIRLKPRTDECQRLLSYQANIQPTSLTKDYIDLWGNHVETFFIPEQHQSLEVGTTSVVSIQKSPFIHRIDYSPEMKSIFHSDLFRHHYLSFLNETEYTYLQPRQIHEVIQKIGEMKNPVKFSIDTMRYLHETFNYDGDATHVNTKASEAFDLKKGVCQDITHVMLGILRNNNIPSRYVSGYLYVGENSALIGDSATHAWVEIMVPGIGWVGLDPTNNVEALENHIRVGTGRDYGDVSPLQGVYRGGGHTLDVSVSVTLLEQ